MSNKSCGSTSMVVVAAAANAGGSDSRMTGWFNTALLSWEQEKDSETCEES